MRDSEKGAQVASQFSTVRLVYGDLDSAEILEAEAREADVVLRMYNFPRGLSSAPPDFVLRSDCASADHEPSIKALIQGLATHSVEKPGFLIHTSGTGILGFDDTDRGSFGEATTKIYDDWDGINQVTSLPDGAPHRHIDKIILAAASDNLKTAIVCPPTIYGSGRGPGNKRSVQIPDMVKSTLQQKQAFQVGQGKAQWTNIHVYDLSDLYLKLIEAAVSGGGKATWGKDGYYFAEHGTHKWGEVAQTIALAAHKSSLIPTSEVKSMTNTEVDGLRRHGTFLWGVNSRCKAIRAHRLLNWTPKEETIDEEIPKSLEIEAKALGLVRGHAAQVAA